MDKLFILSAGRKHGDCILHVSIREVMWLRQTLYEYCKNYGKETLLRQ